MIFRRCGTNMVDDHIVLIRRAIIEMLQDAGVIEHQCKDDTYVAA